MFPIKLKLLILESVVKILYLDKRQKHPNHFDYKYFELLSSGSSFLFYYISFGIHPTIGWAILSLHKLRLLSSFLFPLLTLSLHYVNSSVDVS